ncbi:MAG: polysaccharide deacetylase family protein [Acidimicrobiales bacterium]
MRSRVGRFAHLGLKVVAVAADVVRSPRPGVTVLEYHRVGGGTSLELDLESSVFAAQMKWLVENCLPVSLDAAVDLLERGPAAATSDIADSRRPVVVTFDDGTADFMQHALPALVQHNVPATYYVATKFVDEQVPFPNDGTPLTWGGLAEAISTGLVTVGSHTHSHAVLDKVEVDDARDEVQRSVDLIGEHLGVAADHFAYPKGVFGGDGVHEVLRASMRSAALAGGGANPFGGTDLFRLDRVPVQRSDAMAFFRRKAEGGLALEGAVRQVLNRRRYRTAAN